MNQEVSEIEAVLLLKNEERKREAEAVLARPAARDRWLMGIACGSAAGLASYLIQGSSLSHEVKGLFVGLFAGAIGLGIENWSIKRRLEAVIQLLRVHEAQNLKD